MNCLQHLGYYYVCDSLHATWESYRKGEDSEGAYCRIHKNLGGGEEQGHYTDDRSLKLVPPFLS